MSLSRRTFNACLVVVAALFCTVLQPSVASASFTTTKTLTATFGAATLQAPGAITVTPNGDSQNCGVTLTWSLPSTGVPTNWIVQRYIGTTPSGNPRTLTGTITSYFDGETLVRNTTYTWQIRGVAGSFWTSPVTISPAESLNPACR